jgi:hypothetical protein
MVVSPVGLETKNYCAGEGQQQFSSQSADRIKTNDRPDLLSEGVPDINKTLNVNQWLISGHETQVGLETKTDWLSDRRS